MRSASVDFPWSMWAMIEKLRMFAAGAVKSGPLWSGRLDLRQRVRLIRRREHVGAAVVTDGVEPAFRVQPAAELTARDEHSLFAVQRTRDHLAPFRVDDHRAAVAECLLVGQGKRKVVR